MAHKIKVGLYGNNGHQIQKLLVAHPDAELVAVACADIEQFPGAEGVRRYSSIQELAQDNDVQLVSLCSPIRGNQAEDAILCLEAGKHVYAEKPSALTEASLDRILQTSERTGCLFREMAGTTFEQPYLTLREIVRSGKIGDVVQVFAQKSYPYHERRPQDEFIDGGLICQNAIHAFRFVEHTAGVRIQEVSAVETSNGNPVSGGGLRMAASISMLLLNGGVASIIANYLNPIDFGSWGNEHLRIFGTKGFIETVDGGKETRLFINGRGMQRVNPPEVTKNYFDMVLDTLLGKGSMPLSLEEELHPLRIAIRAKQSALHF